MTYATLNIDRDTHVATITLNRPDKRNPLDALGARELTRALWELHGDADVRVVVLAAAGPVFCAGGDLATFESARALEMPEHVRPIMELAETFFKVRLPTVAQVHGHALGGGAGLVSMCDFAFMAEGAEIGYPEINLGIIPATVSVLLARMVPRRVAAELVFTGRRIDAQEAARLGLVNAALPVQDLEGHVTKIAYELAQKSPLALRQLKAAFYGQADLPLSRALELAVEKFASLMSSDDAREGLRAFAEKRKAQWKGQ